MTKNIAIFTVIFVLIVVGLFVFNRGNEPADATVYATYYSDSSAVDATFDTIRNTVSFTERHVGTVTLTIAVSGSGARYANSDESIVFWEHRGEATITKNGEEVFKGKKNE